MGGHLHGYIIPVVKFDQLRFYTQGKLIQEMV